MRSSLGLNFSVLIIMATNGCGINSNRDLINSRNQKKSQSTSHSEIDVQDSSLKTIQTAQSFLKDPIRQDVNRDGHINQADAQLLATELKKAGPHKLLPNESDVIDVNRDGELSVFDVIEVVRYIRDHPLDCKGRTRFQNGCVRQDVNSDGKLDSKDLEIVICELKIRGPHKLTKNSSKYLVDVDGDGELSIQDALEIVRHLREQP